MSPRRGTHRSRRPAVVAVAVMALLTGCTTGQTSLLLLPADGGDLSPVSASVLQEAFGDLAGQLPDVRSATTLEEAPGDGAQACGTAVADGWTEQPMDAPVLALPGLGYTVVRSGATAVADVTLTFVCDLDADGRLLVADNLVSTGTTQSVGNDYVARLGTILGRVDVGIPEQAVIAVQTFDTWSLLVPLDPEMVILRLHALEGGSDTDGYDVGSIQFFDAEGVDVTTASIPIPDVVHGVPRNRGSSVNPRD